MHETLTLSSNCLCDRISEDFSLFRVGRFVIRINQPRMWSTSPLSSDRALFLLLFLCCWWVHVSLSGEKWASVLFLFFFCLKADNFFFFFYSGLFILIAQPLFLQLHAICRQFFSQVAVWKLGQMHRYTLSWIRWFIWQSWKEKRCTPGQTGAQQYCHFTLDGKAAWDRCRVICQIVPKKNNNKKHHNTNHFHT